MWKERVELGANLMDTKVPGWFKGIDFKRLHISDGNHCILSQTLGNFWRGCETLGIKSGDAVNFGLDCIFSEEHLLTTHWKEEVNKRLEKEKV